MAEQKNITVTEQFLKDLYEIKCVPDLKAALEKHFGEVVSPEVPQTDHGQIWLLRYGCPGLLTFAGGGDLKVVYLDGDGWGHINLIENGRLMRSGTVTINVLNGKVVNATVQEDS